MATDNIAAKLSYNNVISMGISYSWEHGLDEKSANSAMCVGVLAESDRNANWIKRTKTIDLDVVNLDLVNTAAQVGNSFSDNQAKYVGTDTASIYANGLYAGHGRLTSYSINEGSLSNLSITSLTYEMTEGGQDEDPIGSTEEEIDDPISRSESIQVTRDIQGKTYTIQHDYSVSYGDDFDLVSDHPLYADDPTYKSVAGRLTLAQNEATQVLDVAPVNYTTYLPALANYTMGDGFNLEKLQGGCSGAFSTSDNTKNLINGDYSASKTSILKYTGANLDAEPPGYELEYSMSYNEDDKCATVKCAGSVKGIAGGAKSCKVDGEQKDASYYAQSGYDKWVKEGDGKTRLTAWFNAVQVIEGTSSADLNNKITNVASTRCVPSIQRDERNDGTIQFEFEMDNCKANKGEEGEEQYTFNETTTFDYGKFELCDKSEQSVTTVTIAGSVDGKCGLQVDEGGGNPRWAAVEGIYNTKKAAAEARVETLGEGELWAASSSQTAKSPYQGKGTYSVTWSDSPKNQNCEDRAGDGEDEDCFSLGTKIKTVGAKPRYVDTPTSQGIVTEVKGSDLPRKDVTVKLISKNNTAGDCNHTAATALAALKVELEKNVPACIIDSLSWSIQKSAQQQGQSQVQGTANMGGIDSG